MSDNRAQAQVSASNAATPDQAAVLTINFTDGTGKQVGAPIVIRVPRELSKKLVKMYLLEMMIKLIKSGMDVLVSGLGW